jgi:hypothetical protein
MEAELLHDQAKGLNHISIGEIVKRFACWQSIFLVAGCSILLPNMSHSKRLPNKYHPDELLPELNSTNGTFAPCWY